MVTTGPRVDIIWDHSTFFRGDAALSDSRDTLPVELTLNGSEAFGSTDDLTRLLFILWEFLPEQVCYVRHSPVGRDHQDLHD